MPPSCELMEGEIRFGDGQGDVKEKRGALSELLLAVEWSRKECNLSSASTRTKEFREPQAMLSNAGSAHRCVGLPFVQSQPGRID